MPLSQNFYLVESISGSSVTVQIMAVDGTNVDSVNFALTITSSDVSWTGLTGPTGWVMSPNYLDNQGGAFDASGSPVAPAEGGDGMVATLTFTLTNGATAMSGTITVTAATDGNGQNITVVDPNTAIPCYAAGTHILTICGEILVEDLVAGDIAVLHDGTTAPISWIGHRSVNTTRHPRPWDVCPIRVRADALGRFLPHHDLVLSPDHALYMEGNLVPVRYLLNGVTIVQEETAEVTYFHVELPQHAVLIAEGAPAESYLDTGNRSSFANGGKAMAIHADFARTVWDEKGCAPVVRNGPVLVQLKLELKNIALDSGYTISDEADTHLVVDGVIVAAQHDEGVLRFALPASAQRAVLVSRSERPADIFPASTDCRRLGVSVAQITLDDVAVVMSDAILGEGWHEQEPNGRWTNGAAAIAVAGVRKIEIRLGLDTMRYWTMKARPHTMGQMAA